jgi:hypothetical protein
VLVKFGAGVVRVLHADDEIYGVKFRELGLLEQMGNIRDSSISLNGLEENFVQLF